jgi:hypothetical protein
MEQGQVRIVRQWKIHGRRPRKLNDVVPNGELQRDAAGRRHVHWGTKGTSSLCEKTRRGTKRTIIKPSKRLDMYDSIGSGSSNLIMVSSWSRYSRYARRNGLDGGAARISR